MQNVIVIIPSANRLHEKAHQDGSQRESVADQSRAARKPGVVLAFPSQSPWPPFAA